MERWRQGDPMGWAEISAEDVTYIDPGLTKPIIGLEEYKAYLKQIEGKVYYQGSEFIDPKVVIFGDVAVLTYNYRSTITTPEGSRIDQTLWNTTEVYFQAEWTVENCSYPLVIRQPRAPREPGSSPTGSSCRIRNTRAYLARLWRSNPLQWSAGARETRGDSSNSTPLMLPTSILGTPQRVNGLDALKAELAQREGKIHYDVMEFIAPRVQVQGNVAVLTYRFFSTQLNPDGSISSRIPWNCSEVYVCDRWQMADRPQPLVVH